MQSNYSDHPTPIRVQYRFQHDDWKAGFDIHVNPETLRSEPLPVSEVPRWAALDYQSCEGCEWKESGVCPIAERLAGPMEAFREVVSFEAMEVQVKTEERTYTKTDGIDAQQGLSSMFGLLMATSGCPKLAAFRPMARYHLPFSTFDETFFRVTGICLMTQLFKSNEPITRAGTVERLNRIYADAAEVNQRVLERLRSGFGEMADSSPNAVVLLASFSGLVPLMADKQLAEVEKLFNT